MEKLREVVRKEVEGGEGGGESSEPLGRKSPMDGGGQSLLFTII